MRKITISKEKWDKIPKDYKSDKNGVKSCFLGCIKDHGGTQLAEVKIED